MVKSVEINNFRGFEHFKVDDLARVNVVVGDNAVGKTALLEAIFLSLSGSALSAFTLKQWRGSNVALQQGSVDSVVEGIYSDLFHDPKSLNPIKMRLTGEGFDNRQLEIVRTRGDTFIPIVDSPVGNRQQRRAQKKITKRQTFVTGETTTVPIELIWTNEHGAKFTSRVLLSPKGLNFEATGEQIPISYMFAAQVPVLIEEAASQYSILRTNRQAETFRKTFMSVFDWIRDISVETVGGTSTILADVAWAKQLLPLPTLSGGTTRAASILLALTRRPGVVVLVDEIESGIYHARQGRFAKALLEMARVCQGQLIMTSHSEEWLRNFLDEAGDKNEDIAFWRMERSGSGGSLIRRFSASEFRSGLEMGEMR